MRRLWHAIFGHGRIPAFQMIPDDNGGYTFRCYCGWSAKP